MVEEIARGESIDRMGKEEWDRNRDIKNIEIGVEQARNAGCGPPTSADGSQGRRTVGGRLCPFAEIPTLKIETLNSSVLPISGVIQFNSAADLRDPFA
jgi:hypothetical protein